MAMTTEQTAAVQGRARALLAEHKERLKGSGICPDSQREVMDAVISVVLGYNGITQVMTQLVCDADRAAAQVIALGFLREVFELIAVEHARRLA